MANSRKVMESIGTDRELCQVLLKLMMSQDSIMAFLSASVIRASIHHYTNGPAGVERENKRMLIQGANYVPSTTTAILQM